MRPLRREMQIVFQDPFGSLSPRMTIADIIAEGLLVHEPRLSADDRDARVIAALNEVNLDPETRFRYPHEFSGGQRQLIAHCTRHGAEPKFVMLDEPTSALDMSVQAQSGRSPARIAGETHDIALSFHQPRPEGRGRWPMTCW